MSVDYLISDKVLTVKNTEFSVKKPSKGKLICYLILIGILFIFPSIMLAFFIVFGLIVIAISTYLWGNYGIKFARKGILSAFNRWKLKKKPTIFHTLIGLKLEPEKKYYIEAEALDLDLGDIKKIFRERLLEAISICVGIAFLINSIIAPYAYTNADPFDVVFNATMIALFAPLFLFFITPMVWIADDLHVHGIDEQHGTVGLKDHVRSGPLSKFLGLAGILLAFDSTLTYSEITGYTGITKYSMSFLLLIFLLSTICAVPLSVGFLYLYKYHGIAVNTIRNDLTEYIPLCVTLVRQGYEEERQNMLKVQESLRDKIGKLGTKFRDSLGISPQSLGASTEAMKAKVKEVGKKVEDKIANVSEKITEKIEVFKARKVEQQSATQDVVDQPNNHSTPPIQPRSPFQTQTLFAPTTQPQSSFQPQPPIIANTPKLIEINPPEQNNSTTNAMKIKMKAVSSKISDKFDELKVQKSSIITQPKSVFQPQTTMQPNNQFIPQQPFQVQNLNTNPPQPNEIICPNCFQYTPKLQFCKFCGKPLP